MANSRVAWLKRELPEMVTEGLLDSAAADGILKRYEKAGSGRGRRFALIAFGVLGAKMIGSGLILLIAHNWEHLTQGVRVGLAMSLLVAAQALVGFAQWRRPGSVAWRESTAMSLTLAIGACLGLISQTYNVFTRPDDFMLSWVLLMLPVVYITRSYVAAALYFVGVAAATASGEGWGDHGIVLWGLLAAIAPYLIGLLRGKQVGEAGDVEPGKVLVLWSAGLLVPFASVFVVSNMAGDLWMIFYSALFAGIFALGSRSQHAALWQRPLSIVGALGVAGLGLSLTFAELWSLVELPNPTRGADPWFTSPATWILTALLTVAVSSVAVRRFRQRRWATALLYSLPLAAVTALATTRGGVDGTSQAMMMNVYVFALGLTTLLFGLFRDRLLLANAGMALLSALFFFRFVDADLNLVLRGVAFILIGIGFLAMNVKLLWAREEVKP